MFLLGVGQSQIKNTSERFIQFPLLIILMFFVKQEPLFVAGGAYMGFKCWVITLKSFMSNPKFLHQL